MWTAKRRGNTLSSVITRSSGQFNSDRLVQLAERVIGKELMLEQEEVQRKVQSVACDSGSVCHKLKLQTSQLLHSSLESMALHTDEDLKDWENLGAYSFPRIAIIRR